MIEDTLEKGYKTLIEGITYIVDNSITVEQFEDNEKKINPPLVSVHCRPLRRIAPNAPYFESESEFTCMTYIDDDKARTVLKAIYSAVFDYMVDLLPATLATETGLTIDGLVMDDAGDEERDENYQIFTIKLKTYLTK
ncbi:MAG: hypothetical protein GY750_20995 [Lentisphaerae bacterium]|nr:hypothetical protein [Lentisphaerota bacterium]